MAYYRSDYPRYEFSLTVKKIVNKAKIDFANAHAPEPEPVEEVAEELNYKGLTLHQIMARLLEYIN